jgi:hypothetical protein
MQNHGLGELNIPSEAQNLTATYAARPWSEVKDFLAFTTHPPLDKPTEVIGEGPSLMPQRRRPSALDTAMRALSTGGLSLIIKDDE